MPGVILDCETVNIEFQRTETLSIVKGVQSYFANTFWRCHFKEGVCSCQSGLVCTVTKQILKMGEVMLVRQCMPEGEKIEVETLDLEEGEDTPMRNKRWLWFNVRKLNMSLVLIFYKIRIDSLSDLGLEGYFRDPGFD